MNPRYITLALYPDGNAAVVPNAPSQPSRAEPRQLSIYERLERARTWEELEHIRIDMTVLAGKERGDKKDLIELAKLFEKKKNEIK